MGFTIKLENVKILKTTIETLAAIIDETEIKITSKNLSIEAMDPSRVCLLKFEMAKEHFDEYEFEQQQTLDQSEEKKATYKIGLNLDDFEKIMKRSNSDEAITLKYNDDDNKIKIVMQREGSSRARTFTLALLDLDIEKIPMEALLNYEYPAKWVMDPDFIQEAIKDAEIYSDIINIKAKENEGLTFTSSGQIGEMEYIFGIEELIEEEITKEALGAYSIAFLKAIMKITSITQKLKISLETDHPLKMNFTILEGGKLAYFLAPRVEEAEFEEDEEVFEEPEGEFESHEEEVMT